ncbi:MAG: diacylglycerol kinase family protein [Limnospira sp. PMC 1291.21]|nr:MULTISPECIES: diacylglycerol kinase family protein [Limnospira]EKD05814.1 diacylglycerol kinase catalytic region [Arthrospira platensis C1]MDC0836830.1 diacylglycerol kinase family protein [Limnoraphis robusta]QJB27099.1 diacylglycerol kinase [Limnospira fusiformis SAG 85.79]EDZ94723.1 diacylglycerol kinase catalytic region [Limnospira maxima CS-328]MDT9179258.1 diacylglycerol kinase family protein [Limnospira sp. PMC 1238.20]
MSWSNQPPNPSPQRLEIFINPASGKGKSLQIFEQIKPILAHHNTAFNVTCTRHAGDLQNRVKNMDLSSIDGLVVVGGDGSIHEVINGLMNRQDWEKAIKTPLGIIPAGTSNGLCKTLLQEAGETYNHINATIAITRGNIQPLDILGVQQSEGESDRFYYSILSIAWGLIAAVDIKSDNLRFLGSLKTDIYALWEIWKLRHYRGKLSLITADCESPLIIEDDYILLWAMNVPWAAYNLNPAPHSHPTDGNIDVLLVRRGISKFNLIKAFLLCNKGQHLAIPGIEYYKLRGFHLDPQDGEFLAIDGEPISSAPIKVEVLPNLARVFHP